MNKDGIGDVPYRPVTLFSLLVQKYDMTVILIHSLFVDLLDFAESIFPSMTPKTLVDNEPEMRMIE